MSDLKVCRICLRSQFKVYKYDLFQLQTYYEEVMAQKMSESDGLPLYFCYECATVLHKFHKFKEKCWVGQRVLKQVQTSWKGDISYEAVHSVDRAAYNLKSPLEILIVTNRVKTYIVQDETTEEQSESESESIEIDGHNGDDESDNEKEITLRELQMLDGDAACDVNYDSDTPLEDIKQIDAVFKDPVTPTKIEQDSEEKNDKTECKIEDEECNEDFKVDIEDNAVDIEDNAVDSPKTVFVDVKNDVIALPNEPIKERKKRGRVRKVSFANNIKNNVKKVNPMFSVRKRIYPDKESWQIYTLTEEEAVKEFQLKAERENYINAPYKCTDCIRGFSKEDIFKRHKLLRHRESKGSFECRFCHKRFKWDSQRRRHMVEHFKRYKCRLCDIVVCVETTALLHEEYHKGLSKRCHHCGEEFHHRSTYYTHLRTHRSGHVCTLCGMSFVSQMGLNMHAKIKHIDVQVNDVTMLDDDDDDDAPVNTFCDKCDIRFETRKAYEEHFFHSAMHVDGTDELDKTRKPLGRRTKEIALGKRLPKVPLTSGKQNMHDEILAKPRKGRLRRFRKKPTTCNQCGKHFDTQQACMKHHRTEHPRTSFYTERHVCEICGASLALGSVIMHQNMHSRQKEFPCDTCGRRFHTLASKKRHMVTHTGEKPYACSLCDKRFTQSNSCKLHYNTFHLKQPYPKRNRRKRKEDLPPEDKSTSEDSDTPVATAGIKPATRSQANDNNESLHYLTLS